MEVLLKDLPLEDLPRERLERYGAKALSNEELIAILLRTGTKNISAKSLANRVLSIVNNISELDNINLVQLNKIKGMGLAKSTNLIAAIELGRRVYDDNKLKQRIKVRSSIDAYNIFASIIKREKQENFMVIFLDNKSHYISHKILFKGTLNTSLVHPREVLKEALLLNSNNIIVMHNHPSGDVTPSSADDKITKVLVDSLNLIGINLVDHIIVGANTYYSYIENGRLKYE